MVNDYGYLVVWCYGVLQNLGPIPSFYRRKWRRVFLRGEGEGEVMGLSLLNVLHISVGIHAFNVQLYGYKEMCG